MKRRKGCCPVCNQKYIRNNRYRYKSPHHILPQRWFGKHGEVVYLCRSCHNLLEIIIEKVELAFGNGKRVELTKQIYYAILNGFLNK